MSYSGVIKYCDKYNRCQNYQVPIYRSPQDRQFASSSSTTYYSYYATLPISSLASVTSPGQQVSMNFSIVGNQPSGFNILKAVSGGGTVTTTNGPGDEISVENQPSKGYKYTISVFVLDGCTAGGQFYLSIAGTNAWSGYTTNGVLTTQRTIYSGNTITLSIQKSLGTCSTAYQTPLESVPGTPSQQCGTGVLCSCSPGTCDPTIAAALIFNG
jgi:hypothetical protein